MHFWFLLMFIGSPFVGLSLYTYYVDLLKSKSSIPLIAIVSSITVASWCVIIIPYDVYLNSNGMGVGSSLNGALISDEEIEFFGVHCHSSTLQNIYVGLFSLFFVCTFIFLPFAYYYDAYYQESLNDGIDNDDASFTALKSSVSFIVVLAVLLLLGFFYKVETSLGTRTVSANTKLELDRNLQAFREDLNQKDLRRTTNELKGVGRSLLHAVLDQYHQLRHPGFDLLSYGISCSTLVGVLFWILYSSYGLVLVPVMLLQKMKEEKKTSIDSDLSSLRQRHRSIENKYRDAQTGVVRTNDINPKDRSELDRISREQKILTRAYYKMEELQVKSEKAHHSLKVFQPLWQCLGALCAILSGVFILSMIIGNIERWMFSDCGFRCGYEINERSPYVSSWSSSPSNNAASSSTYSKIVTDSSTDMTRFGMDTRTAKAGASILRREMKVMHSIAGEGSDLSFSSESSQEISPFSSESSESSDSIGPQRYSLNGHSPAVIVPSSLLERGISGQSQRYADGRHFRANTRNSRNPASLFEMSLIQKRRDDAGVSSIGEVTLDNGECGVTNSDCDRRGQMAPTSASEIYDDTYPATGSLGPTGSTTVATPVGTGTTPTGSGAAQAPTQQGDVVANHIPYVDPLTIVHNEYVELANRSKKADSTTTGPPISTDEPSVPTSEATGSPPVPPVVSGMSSILDSFRSLRPLDQILLKLRSLNENSEFNSQLVTHVPAVETLTLIPWDMVLFVSLFVYISVCSVYGAIEFGQFTIVQNIFDYLGGIRPSYARRGPYVTGGFGSSGAESAHLDDDDGSVMDLGRGNSMKASHSFSVSNFNSSSLGSSSLTHSSSNSMCSNFGMHSNSGSGNSTWGKNKALLRNYVPTSATLSKRRAMLIMVGKTAPRTLLILVFISMHICLANIFLLASIAPKYLMLATVEDEFASQDTNFLAKLRSTSSSTPASDSAASTTPDVSTFSARLAERAAVTAMGRMRNSQNNLCGDAQDRPGDEGFGTLRMFFQEYYPQVLEFLCRRQCSVVESAKAAMSIRCRTTQIANFAKIVSSSIPGFNTIYYILSWCFICSVIGFVALFRTHITRMMTRDQQACLTTDAEEMGLLGG